VAAKKRKPAARPRKSAETPPHIGASGTGRKTEVLLLAFLIAAGGTWAYANSLNGVFLLDDVRAIVQNETIRSLREALSPPPRSTVSGRPLANLTFALNYAISALDTRSYHVVNILIHLGAALSLFGVVRRTLLTPALRDRYGASATVVAASVALVWVAHPLTTSAVTYVVQRVEALMALFYLLTLYFAIRSWTAAAIVSCALGMATKEVMVTAPIAVLLWDWLFRRGEPVRWRVFGGLAATWIVFAFLVAGEQRDASIALTPDMSWRYLLTQSAVLVRYLRLAVVPSPLIFLYTWPLATSAADVLLPGAFVLTLLGMTIAGLWNRLPLAYAGAWFFLILAPTSSVIPIVTEVAAEHRMYLPLAGVITALLVTAFALVRRLSASAAAPVVAVAATVLFVILGLQTRERNQVYATEQGIWHDTVEKDPANQRARLAYATALGKSGRIAEAEVQFQRAVELDDNDPLAHSRLGSAQAAQGKFDAAIPHLQRALAMKPGDVEAHKTLGQIHALRREDRLAAEHLGRALQVRNDDPQLLLQLASVLADSDDAGVRNPARALQLAEEAVRLTSRTEATALDVLGLAYARNGRLDEAIGAAREALAIARAAGNDAAGGAIEARLGAYEARRRQLSTPR
jgi:protein O-mannosyl-transferase